MGCIVTLGRGKGTHHQNRWWSLIFLNIGVVIATGNHTQIGSIAKQISSKSLKKKTGLQKR